MLFLDENKKPEPIKLTHQEYNLLYFIGKTKRDCQSRLSIGEPEIRQIQAGLAEKGINCTIQSTGYEDYIRVSPDTKDVSTQAIVNHYKVNKPSQNA